ncbi:hypothetical protein ABEB36_001464 [Hypothenemus hampei]|uniref:THAP-type domain-containing protein n=1 Tax=Hypothenemus hampei TaxID=57062 RepID=A0ABD1FGG6_HYPHA
MVRSCCVPNCLSTATTPGHKFLKDRQRQEEWLNALKEENINRNEIHKLHLCYKHFLDNDYTCNVRFRILKSTAIPFVEKQNQHSKDVQSQLEQHADQICKNQELLSLHRSMETRKGKMQLPKTSITTAETVLFFDELFDSFNGRKGQGLSSILKENSRHLDFWMEARRKLRNMCYVEKVTHKVVRRNNPKCLRNWIRTLDGTMSLWKILKSHGFSSLNLKHFNQDVVENVFGQVCDNGHQNTGPTPVQFSAAFKTLLTVNFTSPQSLSSNYEKSEEGASMALLSVLRAGEMATTNSEEKDIVCTESAIPILINNFLSIDVQKIIVKVSKLQPILQCSDCTEFIHSTEMVTILTSVLDIAEKKFVDFCHSTNVKEILKQHVQKEGFLTPFHCTAVYDILIDKTSEIFIYEWCKFINNILNGKITDNGALKTNYIYFQANRMS